MKFLLIFIALFFTIFTFGQVDQLDSLLKHKKYSVFEEQIKNFNLYNIDSTSYWYYRGKLEVQKRNIDKAFKALRKVDSTQLSKNFMGWYLYVLGDAYRYNNQEEKAFSLKLKAQRQFEALNNLEMFNKINYDLHYTLISQDFLEYDGVSYLQSFFENAKQQNSSEQLLTAHLSLSLLKIDPSYIDRAKFHLKEAERYSDLIGIPEAKYKLHNYKAVFYQNYTNDFKKAQQQIDSMLYYANILDSPDRMDSSLKTKAYNHTLQGNYKEAVKILLKAESLPITESIYNRKKGLYEYLSLNYENLNKKDSALVYYKKMVKYRDSVNIKAQNTILTLLETEELSKKNLVLKVERTKDKNRLHWTLGILTLVIILGVILVSYYRNKKRLAEKDKELKAIDARNEEKDRQRQRIAGQLHSDLGSLIVAIQHSFENLKANKDRFLLEEENLMVTTKKLLDEVYQKIRNMAHLEDSASKNIGYWVDIIKDFAAIISESNQLSIEVKNHIVKDIDNVSIETELRRMTTELITNVVKHAQATEVSVDIAISEDTVTIIVEDNGKGFDKTQLGNQKGLGLYSIHKKIDELKGKLTIESIPDQGTTFIIEIPI